MDTKVEQRTESLKEALEIIDFWRNECQRINEESMRHLADLHEEIVELKSKLFDTEVKLSEALEKTEPGEGMRYA